MRPTQVRSAYEVFNRAHKILQRARGAANVEASRQVDYLRDEVANRSMDRLAFIKRDFPQVYDLGSGAGSFEKAMAEDNEEAQIVRSRMGHITMIDSCKEVLYRDVDLPFNKVLDLSRVVSDEENFYTGPNSVDAVLSNLSMHWINDLPGALKRIENMLKPDGMFFANMLGGDSLYELRTSLQLTEMERYGRVAPRLSPLADVRDMGALMQQAKFNLLTIDVDDITVGYPDMYALLEDLKQMGESNAIISRPAAITRDHLAAANAVYKEMHGDDDGSIPATFRIIYMIGWKKSEGQPQPLERGSADVSFKDILPELGDKDKS